jgi:hypothetical protein
MLCPVLWPFDRRDYQAIEEVTPRQVTRLSEFFLQLRICLNDYPLIALLKQVLPIR